MFSAIKFVVAGVIVALFGGFLLAGVFTTQQGDEMAPAAVTASPTAEAEPEATVAPTEPSGPGEPVVRTDILPGVALTVDEVEPGVYKVVNDGARDLAKANNLDIVAGHDGGIWLLRPLRFFRLGNGEWRSWHHQNPWVDVFEVAPDGTVWAMDDEDLYSVGRGGEDWTRTKGRRLIQVTSDGTVWATWSGPPGQEYPEVFGYLGFDGWRSVGNLPSEYWGPSLHVSDRGDVWASDGQVRRSRDVSHFVDGAWRTYDGFDGLGPKGSTALGADGTLWRDTRGVLVRFDGTEWNTFEPPDGTDYRKRGSRWGGLHVAPDGALWAPIRTKEREYALDWGELRTAIIDRPICEAGIDGVVRFDGVTWSRYLQGHCIESMDTTADGSVWLLASESGARSAEAEDPLIQTHVYVITPEAVAASA
jgi:hypothetical protein